VLVQEQIKQNDEGRPVRLMFEDEARFGRSSDPCRCWAPKGVRPTVSAQIVREYEYAYAAVSPRDGVLDTLVLPTANTESMNIFLAEVAQRHAEEWIVLVLDGAGWHRAKRLCVPPNRRLLPLPPWSPPLNPVEQVWDEVREKYFANRRFVSLDQLEEQLVAGLAVLEADTPRMASLTGFDWITCVPLTANWYERLSEKGPGAGSLI
jgi:transposase